jgi:hypothetical protein
MSEVNLQFTVNAFSSVFTVESTALTINPEATQLIVYSGFTSHPPAGTAGNTQVAFNDGGIFGGSNNFTFIKTSNTMTVTNLTVATNTNLNSVANITITGGTAGQYLQTDGAGNISFQTVPNTLPGGTVTQLQYNNGGVFAGIPTVTWTANKLELGPVSNVKINGGTNGYFLQTDGAGNIAWVAGGGSGNGTVGGANAQVQFNNAGAFGGSGAFTFDSVTNTLTVTNITGNGSALTSLTGTSVTGTVANATYATSAGSATTATTSGTVTTAAQPNITSVGTLTSLSVAGTSILQQAKEKVTIVGSVLGANTNFDVLTSAINYYTANMTANVTINIRGNGTSTFNSISNVGDSVTIALVTTCNATPYVVSGFKVDGSNVTPNWNANVIPTITAGINAYNYTLIKTAANTYAVLATFTGYK